MKTESALVARTVCAWMFFSLAFSLLEARLGALLMPRHSRRVRQVVLITNFVLFAIAGFVLAILEVRERIVSYLEALWSLIVWLGVGAIYSKLLWRAEIEGKWD